jgi:hypothetical protein
VLILGIDPGPQRSAAVLIDAKFEVAVAETFGNEILIGHIKRGVWDGVAVESIQSYGMAVGREVFDTCYMIGRIQQACMDRGMPCTLYPRPEYTRRICGTGKINDSILRQALELRFGGYGETATTEVIPAGEEGAGVYINGPRKGQPRVRTVRIPEPLHALNCSDKRSAFAVAAYHIDVTTHERKAVNKAIGREPDAQRRKENVPM